MTVISGESQRYKLAIFDLDGTLTRERSIWEYIHKQLGKWYGFAEDYQKRFLAKEISYERFCQLDAEVWKGMRVDEILSIVKTVPFHAGAEDLTGYLKARGMKLALVSSGLSILSDWVHQKYGFDYSVSNELLSEDGFLTGKVRIQVFFDKKSTWVESILQQFGVKPEETLAVGDSRGDLDMFEMVGFSVAFNSSSPELERIASLSIHSKNLAHIILQLPLK
jgi:phosphoserine phosphatase